MISRHPAVIMNNVIEDGGPSSIKMIIGSRIHGPKPNFRRVIHAIIINVVIL